MKKLITLLILTLTFTTHAQKYFTRTGKTDFRASVKAFEPVEAKNNSTTVILKVETGDIAAQIFMNAFKFKIALMEEHFNENYMDSDTHPKATFRGKIEDFDFENLKEENSYMLSGQLTVKGNKKNISAPAKVFYKNDKIFIKTSFAVAPSDFGIKIPKIVTKKISNTILVNIDYELKEKK